MPIHIFAWLKNKTEIKIPNKKSVRLGQIKKETSRSPSFYQKNFSYFTVAMWAINSNTLLDYPHSLSYQDTNFTKFLFKAIPALASKMEVRGSPKKSEDTTSSSV